jgi:nicotinamidase-related amidase
MADTALLVIDLQRGAFDGVRCPPIDGADALLGNARALIDAARAGAMPVVFVQHLESAAGEPFEENTEHIELHEALGALPADACVRKRASSAFEGTDMVTILKRLGARELVLCGLQSEFCVSNTARSALAAGYGVVVATDAHGTWASGGESAAEISGRVNHELQAAGARLQATAELVARAGRHAAT